jgi:hypothetical protein
MTIQYNEIFDACKLQYIIDNWSNYDDTNDEEDEKKDKTETIIKNYLKNSIIYNENQNIIKVNYKQKHKNIGRFFAKGSLSLQSLPRKIRHTIAKEFYYDIDIVNCHPVILYQYCIKNKIDTPQLKEYIDDRDKILNEIIKINNITKEQAKILILKITNGADGEHIKKSKCLFIRDYHDEIKKIHELICKIPENEKYVKIGKKNSEEKNGYNKNGSSVNVLLTDIENNILNCIIEYLKNKNIINKNVVLVFDGLMILKEDVKQPIEEIIKELEKEIKNKIGYEIKLLNKEMNQDIIIDENLEREITMNEIIAMTDNEASDILLKKIKEKYKLCKCDNVIYMKINNIWTNNSETIEQTLIKICAELNIKQYKHCYDTKAIEPTIEIDGNTYYLNKYISYSSNYINAKNIVKLLYCKIEIDEDLNNKIYYSTLKKLCFNNGYYDFSKSQFINNFDDIETNIKINMDFPERNDKDINDIYDKILNPIFGPELLQPFLHFISRVIAGESQDKLWSICLGERDCGKGVISDLLSNTFQNYVCSINANSLKIDKNNGDEAKKLSWLYHVQYARALLGNEIANSNIIDGNLIKKICSGGDKIQMRCNYVNETNVRIQGTLILFNNDMPKCEPADVFQKLVAFSLPSKFVDEISEEDKIKNPHYKLSDSNIKQFVNNKDICKAFVHIIIDSYQSKKVKLIEKQEEFIDNFKENDEFDLFNKHFEITKNNDDRIKSLDIQEWIKKNNIPMSMAKISNYLTNRGCIHGTHIINKKAYKGYKGIKSLEITSDDLDI